MKKIILGVSIIVTLLVANIAFAGSFSTEAGKWFAHICVTSREYPKGINAAVCDLRDRVLVLEAKAPVPGPQGPKGDKGDKGDTGEQGLQGPTGVIGGTTIVSNSTSGGSFETSVTAVATCPTGTILLSGGAQVTPLIAGRAAITASYPSSTSTWTGVATSVDGGAGSMTVTTYAICSQ